MSSKSSLIGFYIQKEKEALDKYGQNTVIFMQKGDFYELYSINADFPKLCDLLNLQCSRANKKKGGEISIQNPYMAGFPIRSIDRYIRILLDNNITAVIIDETGTNETVKGCTKKREQTKVLTPSTYLESEQINLLLCVYLTDKYVVASAVSLTTGGIELFHEDEYSVDYIKALIVRIQPRELVLYFDKADEMKKYDPKFMLEHVNTKLTVQKLLSPKEFTIVNYQNEFLNKVYKLSNGGISPIEHLHLEKFPLMTTILVLTLQYAYDHDPLIVYNLKRPDIVHNRKFLSLSENTIVQLHLEPLIKFMDHTCTGMGSRLFKYRLMNPLIQASKIEELYTSVEILSENHQQIRQKLKSIRDLDRFQRKLNALRVKPFELRAIVESLVASQDVLQECRDMNYDIADSTLRNLRILINHLQKSLNFNEDIERIFNTGIYSKLDEFYERKDELWNEFLEIGRQLSEQIGETDFPFGTTNDSLYFVVSKKQSQDLAKVRDVICGGTKSEKRITTARVEEIASEMTELKEAIEENESTCLRLFCRKLADDYNNTLNKVSKYIAEIDCSCLSSYLCNEFKFVMPLLIGDNKTIMTELRHPLIESQISSPYVANDCLLDNDHRGMLLYGQNFSGKSSYLRSVGIAFIMAQSGFPVACTSMSYMPIKQLITKISLGDSIQKGSSVFTNELREMKTMIETTNQHSLILADELCSGTEIKSALALVSSTIVSLEEQSTRYIFTSHFHDLLAISEVQQVASLHVFHMKVSVSEQGLVFDRKLQTGKCEDTYGIEVASFMKMPSKFLHMATTIRNRLTHNETIISTKRSNYNKDIYMTECKICGSKDELQTHHIIFQSEHSGKSKNYKSNLIVICHDCHDLVHKNELDINSYIKS